MTVAGKKDVRSGGRLFPRYGFSYLRPNPFFDVSNNIAIC